MNTLHYIMQNFKDCFKLSSQERDALYYLVDNLNKEELYQLQKFISNHWYEFCHDISYNLDSDSYEYITSFEKYINWILSGRGKHKNEPIQTLLKLFTCDNEEQAKYAKEKLKLRFEHQSFLTQRKILKAFLESNDEEDREWAYATLRENWDNYFCNKIQKLWETYHDFSCGILVIKYLPIEYVWKQHKCSLEENYYILLCERLGSYPDFKIAPNKFDDYGEYLYTIAKARGKVNGEDMLHYLFECIAKKLNKSSHDIKDIYHKLEKYTKDNFTYISTKLISSVTITLWRMSDVGYTDEIIYYLEWDKQIQEKFKEGWFEYTIDTPNASLTDAWNLFCYIVKKEFPSEYASMIMRNSKRDGHEELCRKNNSFTALIDQFGLEENEAPF